MIDFENTGTRSLDGAEYLTKDDFVTVFYSHTCKKIGQGKLQQVIASGCTFDICPLQHSGKNAIDFYIASRIGELYGSGYMGTVAILSNDKGFKAVQEYWRKCAHQKREIVLKPDIQQSIVSSNEVSMRKTEIQGKLKDVDILEEFKIYVEKKRIHNVLEELFAGDEYAGMVEQIISIMEGGNSHKILYLDSLKRFGRKQGLEIYQKLKQIV